jgi:CrcB protein
MEGGDGLILNGMLVAIGGFFGAVSRFGVSQWVKKRYTFTFPVGTLAVNLIGSFLLGVIVESGIGEWQSLLGTGFMGAFTTFSTFKLENIEIHAKRNWKVLISYLTICYIGGIFLAFLGMLLGTVY